MLPKEKNITSKNLKLELLNINGVLYKSTRTKLQRKISSSESQKQVEIGDKRKYILSKKNPSVGGSRALFVRGNKFILDKSGFKLTKIPSENEDNKFPSNTKYRKYNSMKRIDIGGLTYVAKSNNEFIRTNMHITRNYLSTTKQKSITTLQNRLVKSNVPCPIYRKLGRCVAFEKGKCPKLHVKNLISICPRFLKGECTKVNCLLSHTVNLSKMPVCKFFLQGLCVRDDCPYLHKKQGKSVEICKDFLNGYCTLAEMCPKRHEFLCPDYESKGKCEKPNCSYCKKRNKPNYKKMKVNNLVNHIEKIKIEPSRQEKNQEQGQIQLEMNQEILPSRYFIDKNHKIDNELKPSDDSDIENSESEENETIASENNEISDKKVNPIIGKRPKLETLPSYIPL